MPKSEMWRPRINLNPDETEEAEWLQKHTGLGLSRVISKSLALLAFMLRAHKAGRTFYSVGPDGKDPVPVPLDQL